MQAHLAAEAEHPLPAAARDALPSVHPAHALRRDDPWRAAPPPPAAVPERHWSEVAPAGTGHRFPPPAAVPERHRSGAAPAGNGHRSATPAAAVEPVGGGRGPRPPVPHHIAPLLPIPGTSGPIGPVPPVAPIVRPVPGQYPESPNPGTLPPGVRPGGPTAPTSGPAPVAPAVPRPADGKDPADDAALREVQRLLGNSLSMAGGPDEVAGRLRAALLLAQPQLLAALPGDALWQRGQLAQALTWLIQHLDRPPLLVAGSAQLGAALAEFGVYPQQLQLIGAALAEAMRAGMTANGWRQDFDEAWRTTLQHVHEWIAHGATSEAYRPVVWTAVVVSHELRRPDLAVVRLRPYLPMPFRPGQYARVEVPELPGVWRPYSLSGAPRRDNIVELHVRAKSDAGVSGALVYRTAEGDRLRIGRAEGEMGLPEHPARDLLLVAGDTGVAPLKAMLTELADTGDRRSAVLFWGVRTLEELYDIDEIAAIARSCRRATVVPVVSEGEAGPYASGLVTDAIAAYGEWSGHEAYLAGPPVMLAATSAALRLLGVAADRIHHDPQP